MVDFDPTQENELQITCSDSSKKQFKFDHVFGPQDNQGISEKGTDFLLFFFDIYCFDFLIVK